MIRTIGAILIAASAAFCGIRSAAAVRSAHQTLTELQSILEFMETEIRFRLLPVPELLRSSAGNCRTGLRELFYSAAARMERDPTCSAERAFAASRRPDSLPPEGFSILCTLSHSLGQSDMEGQMRAVALAKAQLSRLLDALSRDQEGRCRSYCALGVCAGLAIVILLI